MASIKLPDIINIKLFQKKWAKPHGLSLVELTIVLGISSLLVAGSFTWYDSNKVSDFYDQVRQIESTIREVETEVTTNYMPGYNSGCTFASRVDSTVIPPAICPIAQNELILATSVGVDPNTSPPGNNQQLTVGYYKAKLDPATKSVTTSLITPNVVQYSSRVIDLPRTIRIKWIKVLNADAVTGACAQFSGDVSTDIVATTPMPDSTHKSYITFRRDPSIMNHFSPQSPPLNIDNTSYYDVTNVGWGGDNPYGILSGSTPSNIATLPCWVAWQVESTEMRNGSATVARFNAQIIFDVRKRTISLQTNK